MSASSVADMLQENEVRRPTGDYSDRASEASRQATSSSAQASPGDAVYEPGSEPFATRGQGTGSTANGGQAPVEEDVIDIPTRLRVQQVPSFTPQTTKVTVLKEWEGVVDWVEDEWFRARLTDIQHRQAEPELVEIDIEDVAPDDRHLIERGAVFYWDIGRKQDRFGSVQNFSEVRFRRMPAWSKRDLEKARAEAKELRRELFGDTHQE